MTRFPSTLAACALVLCSVRSAPAQDDLARVRLLVGDPIDVTESNGTVISGVLSNVTPAVIALGGHEMPIDSVLKIDRHGDPIWDGALIGAGVGLILSPIASEGCLQGSRVPCVLGPILVYGGIGALWDYLHVGRTTIYRRRPSSSPRVAVAPLLSPDAKGVRVGWSF
jgi:hypothetical protein